MKNSKISFVEAKEAADFCGLKTSQMCDLSVERLIVHELLIRVTGDISVPDGPNYADLGISLRSIASQILNKHILPELDHITSLFDVYFLEAKKNISELISDELIVFKSSQKITPTDFSLFSKVVRSFAKPKKSSVGNRKNSFKIYKVKKSNQRSDLRSDCKNCVSMILNGVLKTHGRLIFDQPLLAIFAGRLFKNIYGSQKIGTLISSIFDKAVIEEEYRLLPFQVKPMVMNTKGASAAGKSSIRPQQRMLAERLKIPWDEFALISPDYWRKFLLDYDSLGSDYKYAAMLTGYELEMIDKKLDLYMEIKAEKNEMPHLLIDRFRFDSFQIDREGQYQSKLLSRFGQKVLIFFVITPPHETVERAWIRGLLTSRYKAVEDLLDHNIEAYTGMPELFFSWIRIKDKDINFEFLDNTVPLGETPKTIAFGRTEEMYILDVVGLNNIDLFKEVNVQAKSSGEVLIAQETLEYEFLRQCLYNIEEIYFINREDKKVYGIFKEGKWIYKNGSYNPNNNEEQKCLLALGWFERSEEYTINSLREPKVVNYDQTLGS